MVYINDTKHPLSEETTIELLFKDINIDISKGIAVAVNGTVIPRSNWHQQKVLTNDKILLIKATQGG